MDVKKIDSLLKYALAAAGQEDPGNREVGPIHLLKYVYLGDLAYADTHQGQTFTEAQWRFHHFGPWALEVFERIEPVIREVDASERKITSPKLEDDYCRWTLVDDELFNELNEELPYETTRAIKRAVHEFGDDTTSLLYYVYSTRPMLTAAPGEILAFEPPEPEIEIHDVVGEPVSPYLARPEPLSRSELESRKNAMAVIRDRVQAKLSAKKTQAKRAFIYTPPRYDEVFLEGLKWLDDLGGTAPHAQEGQLIFSDAVWKSPTRSDSDVS